MLNIKSDSIDVNIGTANTGGSVCTNSVNWANVVGLSDKFFLNIIIWDNSSSNTAFLSCTFSSTKPCAMANASSKSISLMWCPFLYVG